MPDKDTIKQLAEHDVEITDLKKNVSDLQDSFDAKEKREVIREWLYTKCIWVWTLLMGWCFMVGVFIMEHYDKVAIVMIAAYKALRESSK